MILQADAGRLPLPDQSVDLVIGSPPYLEARTYGIAAGRKLEAWVDWMLAVTEEALRVSRGLVVWICCGIGGRDYQPAPEGLIWEGRKRFPTPRPCYWIANKPPAGTKWFSNIVEYAVVFGVRPVAWNPAEVATPLRYTSGGNFRQRKANGERSAGSAYPTHAIRKTVPNWFNVPVGGGLMGHQLATENEAPYPVGVPEKFILTCTNFGMIVADPFCGSGSTAQAARASGRQYITSDLRASQCDLARERLKGKPA